MNPLGRVFGNGQKFPGEPVLGMRNNYYNPVIITQRILRSSPWIEFQPLSDYFLPLGLFFFLAGDHKSLIEPLTDRSL
jgi:hypothetical protein